MTPYEVLCSCGHKATIQLNGPEVSRYHKIKWYETQGLCPDCFNKAYPYIAQGNYKEVRMHYAKYKADYPDCKTKQGTYDTADKTVIVYVPD